MNSKYNEDISAISEYADIINLPHHVSETRPQMSIYDRAAQFAPFAALTGYDAAIIETGRYTENKIELSEYEISILNDKLNLILSKIKEYPEVTILYFIPDQKKSGGVYVKEKAIIKRVDEYEKCLVSVENKKYFIDRINSLNGEFFKNYTLEIDLKEEN